MSLEMSFVCKCGNELDVRFYTFGWKKVKSSDVENRNTIDREDHQYIHCNRCKRITHIYVKGKLEFSGTIYEEHCEEEKEADEIELQEEEETK